MSRDDGALALGKFTFGIVGESPVQVLRREHVQHGIAQELQTFVVALVGQVAPRQERAVHQRMSQQLRILEPVPELRLKPLTGLLAKPEFQQLMQHVLFFQYKLLCYLKKDTKIPRV